MKEITCAIINYNGIKTVFNTIESIYNLQGVNPNIIVIDDGSSDGSPDAIQTRFPNVIVYKESENTKDLNRLRNKGLHFSRTRLVLLTDNDVIFSSDAVIEMINLLESDDDAGACIPRLMYMEDRDKIYSEGGKVHYIGASIAPSRDSHKNNVMKNPQVAVGGGIILFDTQKLQKIGFFDEEYSLAWGDDGEIQIRLLIAGYKCYYNPSAIAYHEYKEFNTNRYYRARGQIYNRLRFIFTYYEIRTILLIFPALIFYELIQFGFYFIKKIPHLYLQGIRDALKNSGSIKKRRDYIQSLRQFPDTKYLYSGPIYLRPDKGLKGKINNLSVTIISGLLSIYWWIIYPFLRKK